jgi:integrase/recombinase XerD
MTTQDNRSTRRCKAIATTRATPLDRRQSPTAQALTALAAIPEEQLWLEGQRSHATRTAYRNDVQGFMRFLRIQTTDELRLVNQASVIAFQRHLEDAGAKPTTINRKLAALSSLFAHLVRHQVIPANPCHDILRPRVSRRTGTTPAFSAEQAAQVLDAPSEKTLQGLRDRAILAVGFQAGPRRASIVALRVRDFRQDHGFDTLRFVGKRNHEHSIALHPLTVQRLNAYLAASGHAGDGEAPLFQPVQSRPGEKTRRHLRPDAINHIVQRYAKLAKIKGAYTAHSMRATFITVALAGGAQFEEVQRAAGHADPNTTKLYDRRGFAPEKSAAFYANYPVAKDQKESLP